jgi:hypothetical protein
VFTARYGLSLETVHLYVRQVYLFISPQYRQYDQCTSLKQQTEHKTVAASRKRGAALQANATGCKVKAVTEHCDRRLEITA